MSQLKQFFPTSPDPFLVAQEDMALAKFGHLNAIVDAYNALDTTVSNLPTPPTPVYNTVTQTGTITTAVTLNATKGKITTVSTSIVGNECRTDNFTFNNSYIKTDSVVLVIAGSSNLGPFGEYGVIATISDVTNGSCKIRICNATTQDISSKTITLYFTVI